MSYKIFLKYKVTLFFFALVFIGFYVRAHITGPAQEKIVPVFTKPYEVVRIFLEAVKRGELIVFEYTLTPEMVIPERVDYSYKLDSPTPTITIYSSMIKPMVFPQFQDLAIYGVSASMDAEGVIFETKAHVQSLDDK